MKSNKHAGQFKLRGKKCILLTCKCCTVENWKQECRDKEAIKEIRGTTYTHMIIDELQEPIGYTETETGYEPIYAAGKGMVVTHAFIMCKECSGPISPNMGPRYNAVCLSCYAKKEAI